MKNAAYTNAALTKLYAELDTAQNGSRNTSLFKIGVRAYEFAAAGEVDTATVEQELWARAERAGLSAAEIRATLKSAQRKATPATIPEPKYAETERSAPSTKRTYISLLDYAEAHHAPLDAFLAAGWNAKPERHRDRQALRFTTATGARWRYLDDDGQPFDSPSNYHACWYLLETAINLAREQQAPLILCNGEPSAIVAQHYGVPAACITGSGERRIPEPLLTDLQAQWDGHIIVALDCDDKGRQAAATLVKQLVAAGYVASAVEMKGSAGFDLADFCGLYEHQALESLLACMVPDTIVDPEPMYCTDLGNAQRLVMQNGADLRYVKEWGWLVWDGRRWKVDHTGEIERRAKLTALNIYQEAATAPEHLRPALAKHAIASQSAGKIAAMITLAESEKAVRAEPADFDTNDWLLSCSNGTLDLKRSELRDHDRTDMLTKAIDVPYDPTAPAALWLAFLDRIFASNTGLISYVQRMIGYTLTGSTGAQAMFIAYGTGANGKSVLIDVVRALLGGYASNAAPETFLTSQQERIRSDLARLAGVRFVSTVELDEGRRLSEALVKQVTGGDTITARFLHKDEFEFAPKFKLWMVTNHKPIIRGTDYAIWRRIRLIPFTVTIPEAERDPQMTDKLRAELPGILAWALRGCAAWLQSGLQEPEEVKAATNAYRNEQDVIAQFLDDTCVTGRQMRAEVKAVYAAYQAWCEMGGEHPVNQRRFGGQMTERGFDRERTSRGWVYVGVGLLNMRHDPEPEANQTEQHDLNDPNDPIIQVSQNSSYMREKPRSMDHLDHLDHTLPDGQSSDPLARVPWESVRDYLARGDRQRIASFCKGLWRADYDQVIAEADRRWPELVEVGHAATSLP